MGGIYIKIDCKEDLNKMKQLENKLDELELKLSEFIIKYNRDTQDAWKIISDMTTEIENLRGELNNGRNYA